MLSNTKARYQNSVQLFISSIQCKFQPSIFSQLTLYLEFSSFGWQKTIAFIARLVLLQTNCCSVVISVQVQEQSSQEQRFWVEHFFSGKGILAEWRCANCKAITLLLGAASSANCKAIRSTRAPAIREGGLQWSPLWELAGFPQLYPLRSLFPSGNSLRPSKFCRSYLSYLIFVIFFTRAKFLENMPLFRIKSVENANFLR